MIVNPFTEKGRLTTFRGTRILRDDFNLLDRTVKDVRRPYREWTIVGVYAPLTCRAVEGIRVKVVDESGVITFVEQMDLEVLMGLAHKGDMCAWSGKRYLGPGDNAFAGLVCDEDDLLDDLMDTENVIRMSTPVIPDRATIHRKLHLEFGHEVEETWMMLGDSDGETGMSPDLRMETLERRWKRISRTPLRS